MMGMPFCVNWMLLTQLRRYDFHIVHCRWEYAFLVVYSYWIFFPSPFYFCFIVCFMPFTRIKFIPLKLLVILVLETLNLWFLLFHMTWQSMIELSRTQDEEVGDGTTSVIVLGVSSSRTFLPCLSIVIYVLNENVRVRLS